MELYSSHAQRNPTSWYCTPDTVRTLPPVPAITPLNHQPPPSNPATTVPPLPHPPLRLLLPPPALSTSTHASPSPGGYGTRTGYSAIHQTNRTVAAANPPAERATDGRQQGGSRRTGTPPAQSPTPSSRVACFKCQGWGHFASQCPSQRQATRPARALLVEIHDDEHPPPPDVMEPTTEIYEADPELAAGFEGPSELMGCIIKEI